MTAAVLAVDQMTVTDVCQKTVLEIAAVEIAEVDLYTFIKT